jgi:hypothetical protein
MYSRGRREKGRREERGGRRKEGGWREGGREGRKEEGGRGTYSKFAFPKSKNGGQLPFQIKIVTGDGVLGVP